MSLDRFIAKWTHPEYPPNSVVASDLDRIEEHFGFAFPLDYRTEILKHGLPRPTIKLLDAIVDQQLDLEDVGDFLSPDEVAKRTAAWRSIGLADRFVIFASDCMGNAFCFNVEECPTARVRSAPVWFFDHDLGTVKKIARSFGEWVARFCQIDAT